MIRPATFSIIVLPLSAWLCSPKAAGQPLTGDSATRFAAEETGSNEPNAEPAEATEPLSVSDAVALALERNPTLAAAGWGVRAEEAGIVQARPNPTFGFEAEGFGGEGELRDTDSLETTYALSQLIELGGKRSRRAEVAALERDAAQWDYQRARLRVIAETGQRFVDLLAAEERLRIQRDLVSMASEALNVVRRHVEAGKASPVDETRAGAELSRSRIEMDRAASQRDIARLRLAAMWGRTAATFDEVAGDVAEISEPPPLDRLLEALAESPELARWETEVRFRRERIRLERASAAPDLNVGGGVRHENASGSTGFVLAVSIPLPLFDRNAGAVREAGYRVSQAESGALNATIESRVILGTAYQSLLAAYRESVAFREGAIPAAETAYRTTEEAYRLGKLDYLDVLSSRAGLARVRTEYLDALVAYHTAVIEIERILGRPISGGDSEFRRGERRR